MNSIIPGTIEEPGLDTYKVGTPEAPSIENRRDPLTAADAHLDQRMPASGAGQLTAHRAL
jgi:hypothetical protein